MSTVEERRALALLGGDHPGERCSYRAARCREPAVARDQYPNKRLEPCTIECVVDSPPIAADRRRRGNEFVEPHAIIAGQPEHIGKATDGAGPGVVGIDDLVSQ